MALKAARIHLFSPQLGLNKEKIYVHLMLVCVCVCVYIYIYIITVLLVTKSLCGFVSNQVQYNMENAQYLE